MALHSKGEFDEAITFYNKGIEFDANNAQCKQMLEKCEEEKIVSEMRASGGGMGGGMGMPGSGGMNDPFSAEKLESLKTHPKTAAFFKDP